MSFRNWDERPELRRIVVLLLLGLVLVPVVRVLEWSPPMRHLERWADDRRLRVWRQLSEADTRSIVIVALDEDSLQSLNLRWPVPRGIYARVLDALRKGGASAIGFTILVEGPGPNPVDDALFSRELQNGHDVVLASRIDESTRPPRVVPPYFQAPSGFTNMPLDSDGVVRSFYVWPAGFSDPPDSMALELLRLYYQDQQFAPRGFADAPGTTYPVAYAGYAGDSYHTLSLQRVLNGRDLSPEVKGKIVLVGSTVSGPGNAVATPFSRRGPNGPVPPMSGVELMANVLFTMMSGDALQVLGAFQSWCLVGAIVFLGFQIFVRCHPALGVMFAATLATLYLLGSTYAMIMHHRLLPLVGPLLGIAMALAVGILYRTVQGGIELIGRLDRGA